MPKKTINKNRVAGEMVCLLALVLAAPSLTAQTLYRCPGQGSNGATLIQDQPCPDGREAATTLDSREVRVSPQRQRSLHAQQVSNERMLLARSSNQSNQLPAHTQHRTPTQAQRRQHECQNAKRWRSDQRRALGLNRSYESLSALDRHVREKCKDIGH